MYSRNIGLTVHLREYREYQTVARLSVWQSWDSTSCSSTSAAATTTIMNQSEFSVEVDDENFTNVNITQDPQTASKKLMFLIEGVCLGLVALCGITGKYKHIETRGWQWFCNIATLLFCNGENTLDSSAICWGKHFTINLVYNVLWLTWLSPWKSVPPNAFILSKSILDSIQWIDL